MNEPDAARAARDLSDVLLLSDWNGTIADDLDRAAWALNEVLASRGDSPLTFDRFRETFRLPIAALFADLGIGAGDAAQAEEDWNALMATRSAPGRSGHRALLSAQARGAVVGVVSAATARSVVKDVHELGLEGLDVLMAPADDKRVVLASLRPRRRHGYYLGDTPYDMRCSADAGYVAIAVSGGYSDSTALRAAGAAHVVTDLYEVLEIIDRRNDP